MICGLSVSNRLKNFDKFLSERSSEVRKVATSSWAFNYYIIYLTVRVIGLSRFVTVLFPGMFPIEYSCSWRPTTNENSSFNSTILFPYNETFVNCEIRDGNSEWWIKFVVAVDVLSIIMTICQLIYLLNKARNDNFFTSDKEFFTVYILQKRAELRNWIEEIKNKLHLNKLFNIHDNVGNAQMPVQNLKDIYVNVIMQAERQLSKAYPETYKRHEILHSHFKLNENAKKLTRATDIFKSIPNSKSYPSSILVIGRPGIGKTMLTKKLIHEWKTNEDDFWRDKLVILLQCRAIKEKYITFEKMLKSCVGFSFEQFSDIYEFVMLNPERTVLVVDGLDELPLDNGDLRTDDSGSPNDKRAVITHLSMLVEGKLLPDVTVLITSRPTAEHKFRDMEFARTVEILGLFEDEIKEFVEKFCHEDRNITDRILNKIEISLELRSFCYIPINTKIVCMTLKECFADDENYSPKTITELYDRAIKVLLWQSHPLLRGKTTEKDYLRIPLPSELDKDLQEIKYVAMEGLKDGRLIFERKSNSNFKNLENCGIFNKIYDDERHLYCFLHLTLQEFFAAWYIVDDWQNIGKFLDDHVEDPKWHLVIEFAAGLVGSEKKEKGKDISVILERLESWMSHLFFSEGNKALGFLGMKCFYELQDDDEMRSAYQGANLLIQATKNENCKLTKLKICGNNISKQSAKSFAEALKSQNCKLTELDVHFHSYANKNTESLRKALKSKNCKYAELFILQSFLTAEEAKCLSEALKSKNCKLIKLDVSNAKIEDEGAKYLSEALKSENCKLTELDLSFSKIGDEGAKALSEALKSENCNLTEFNLRDNNLGHEGAKSLSEALKSDEGAKSLSEALKSENCSLTKLDLGENNLGHEGDEGAKFLSEALKRENCKLTDMALCGNNIGDEGDEGAKFLSEALKRENCKLTELALNRNKIGDEGAKSLSEAFKSENCKLTELDLSHNSIGDEV
ncbi:NLR family CARD domain-containing protein 3-like [Xenia sp. Carnegie-2017]|uniref:NLR family CARD domain-containing protein 3-like n=1 Tax=Xenia sp. Carnegie-2017 TaxID=2897299 RepID=UPI001F03A39F|nr:NLR family CARD domain-containing protein 3-like [Xenia sp. Carnegie-2017]